MSKAAVFWLILWACGCGLGLKAAEAGARRLGDGPLGLTLTLSSARTGAWEPILAAGKPGSGDVVFCRKLDDGRTAFGWQQTGHVAFLSDPIRLPENVPLEVMISLGSFFPQDENDPSVIRKELRELALVQVRGRTLVIARGAFARIASAPETGTNHVGGSFASVAFSGRIANVHPVGEDVAFAAATFPGSLVAEEVMDHDAPDYPGPLVLQLLFAPNATGRNEPLLVTGKTGAGDILFVRYVDESHVQIGFDHWLKGGPISEVFPCDYSRPHALTLAMGSLLPPISAERPDSPEVALLRTRCIVLFDGKPAIDWTTPFYPAALAQIFIGANPIGGSSADAKFNGTIVKITRARPEHVLPAP
jgi:hypothetical protein